jgi:agmatinase
LAASDPVDPGLLWPAPRTFFGVPRCDDLGGLNAEVAFVGVPYEGGALQPFIRTGQSAGPAFARLNSWTQLDYTWPPTSDPRAVSAGWFDVEAGREFLVGTRMCDVGDVAITGAEVEENLDRITTVSRAIVGSGALIVAVGGDHSIAYPVGRGLEALGPIDVVHFDAHADFSDHVFGARYSHGSQLRRLAELPFVRSVTPIGLRNVWKSEFDDMVAMGVSYATTHDVIEEDARSVVDRLVPAGGTLYVSIDIDVLDLAIVPGTTLPEPGGLSYRELRALLEATARRARVRGFDIVELDAPHDLNASTARVTTWLIVHFLSAIFDQR